MPSPTLLAPLVVLVAFLGLLGGLAVAVTKTVRPDGRVERGFFGFLGTSLVLLFLSGLGLVGTGLFAAALGFVTVVENNPIRHLEVRRGPSLELEAGLEAEHPTDGEFGFPIATYDHGVGEGPVHLIVSVERGAGDELLDFLEEALGLDRRELEEHLTHERVVTERGEALDLYDVVLPISEHELEHLERDLSRELDGADVTLPDGLSIEFGRPSRRY